MWGFAKAISCWRLVENSFEPSKMFDSLPKDKPVILVCQAGGRSARALSAAMAAGHKDIAHYAPGTGGWRMRGGPVDM
jgi:rhodanese-related sulfurtransferase